MMKKYILKIIPLTLIFVFMFSITALAADPEQEPMYPSTIYDEGYRFVIDFVIKHHRTVVDDNPSLMGPFFVYAKSVNLDSGTMRRADVFICPLKDVVISSDGTYATASFKRYNVQSNDCISIANINTYSASSVYFAINNTVRNNHIYVSQDIYNSSGVLMYKCPDAPENPYGFDIFQGIEDFTQSSINAKNEIDSQIPSINTSTDSTTNDSIFGKILQSIGTITNNISNISQQISNQLQNFVENFYNVFSDYLFNVLTEIKDSLANILPEGFITMVEQLYQAGLDSSGKFSLNIFFKYLLLPDDRYLENKIDTVVLSKFGFIETAYAFLDSIKSALNQASTIAPVITTDTFLWNGITIPPFTISFEWYADFKPYVDPIVSAFCWVTFVYHTIVNLPSLIRGGSVAGNAFNDYMSDVDAVKRSNSDADKISRNYGWK